MVSFVDQFWLAVALLFGLGFAWSTYRSVRQSWAVLSTRLTAVRDAGTGTVRLRGTVRPSREPLSAPLSGRDCVLAQWEVREGVGNGASDTLLADGYDAVPFELSDGTGAVEVQLGEERSLFEYDIELSTDYGEPVFEVPYPEERPPPAAELEARESIHDWQTVGGTANDLLGVRRTYYEWRVERGDEVTVYGHAREDGGTTVVEPADTFVLGEGALSRTLWFRTLVSLGATLCFLGGGTYVLAGGP